MRCIALAFFLMLTGFVPTHAAEAPLPEVTAADENDGLALHNLGDRYRYGVGVEANLWVAFAYYQKAAATGLPLGYEDVGDSILRDGIAEGLMLDKQEQRETAARWYRKAAAQGRSSAQKKLERLGFPGNIAQADAPLTACPAVELPGKQRISGTWLRATMHHDVYGYLIQTADGATVDVIMGNGEYAEFTGVQQGDVVTLTYTSSRGLDPYSAACVITNYYLVDSGNSMGRQNRKLLK